MAAMFDAIGIGEWFRYLTGAIEVGSAISLLVPSFAAFGAVALSFTMLGAVTAHLFVIGGSPVLPIGLLLGSLTVAWVGRDQLAAALRGWRRPTANIEARARQYWRGEQPISLLNAKLKALSDS